MVLRIVPLDSGPSFYKEAVRILEYSHGFLGLGSDGLQLWFEKRLPFHDYEMQNDTSGRLDP